MTVAETRASCSSSSLDALETGISFATSRRVSCGATLTFKDLSFSATLPGGESKKILEPCSGHLEANQLVALMGPSGSGKTTLMDMLAMKKSAAYEGKVYVNGHERNSALFQRIAAYVGQEDRMPAHWKVREALEFNAFLKREMGVSLKAVKESIDGLLDAFGLTEVADTYIGGPQVRGISGGQRRRVSLARGVAAQAQLLFCDEPTSGLSAADAESCVKALRWIAKNMNVLVIVVIHQPRRELAEMFDTLILLTSNPGRTVYFGPMKDAAAHFKVCGHPVPEYVNPTDFFLDRVTPGTSLDDSAALVSHFDASMRPHVDSQVVEALELQGLTVQQMLQACVDKDDAGRAVRKVRLSPFAVPFLSQTRTLLSRQVRLTMRNPAAVGGQLLVPSGMGVVLGLIFKGVGMHPFGIPHVEFVFIVLTMLSLQSLSLMPMLIEDRGFMKYETSEKLYTEAAQILTTLCVTNPLSLLGAACQTTVIFAMSELDWTYFSVFMLWNLLLFLVFDALFHCVSAASPDAQRAQAAATPLLVIFMLFNGVVVTKKTSPGYFLWIFDVSPTGYALQAIITRMGSDGGAVGEMIIDTMGYQEGQDAQGIIIILVMTVGLRFLQFLATKFLFNIKR